MAPPPRAADLPFPRVACGLINIPPPIRMKAYRSKRSFFGVSTCLSRKGLAIFQSVLCLVVPSACQTGRVLEQKSATGSPEVAIAEKAGQASAMRAPRTPTPSRAVVKPQPASMRPPQPETVSTQVATRLGTTFGVTGLPNEALLVRKSSIRSTKPSLFEEAIILTKLRAFLKSTATATTPPSVTFQNGTAAVDLPPTINSGTASVLIAKMLSLEGVNEVRAGFDGENRDFQEPGYR